MTPDPAPYDERGRTGSNVPDWGTLGTNAELGDEEVAELKYPTGLKVFHRMRVDGQIDALMKSVSLPIRRRKWFIDPNGARDEVVEGVSNDFALPVLGTDPKPLPRRRRFNHDDHLRHALLALAYGHMFMEQLGIIDDGLKWRLKKLAPRMPLTITKIEVADDGGLKAIWQKASQQQIVGGRRPARPRVSSENNVITLAAGMFGQVDIPVSRLVAYVWEREGGNWAGRSMLRPLYPHWLLKDILMRVDTIKHERFGAGIPTGKAPSGGDVSEYARMAQQIRAGESAGAGLPSGAELFVEGIRGQIPDIIASIRYHDEQMAKDFLAMFLQLGQTATGSRALGNTFVDFFEMSLETVADWYGDITSEHVIEDWVDWNYGVEEPAPRLVSFADDSGMLPTTELINMVESGIIVVDDNLRSWVTRRYSMPKQPTLEEEQEMKLERAKAAAEAMPGVPVGNNGQPPPDPNVYPPPPAPNGGGPKVEEDA